MTLKEQSNAHAAGILYRAAGRILLLKRSPNAPDFAGHWCTPGGGIDAGETPEQAARRESMEEVGYKPKGDINFVAEFDGFVTYGQKVTQFGPVLNDEHTGYVWASPDDLPSPMHPGVLKVLNAGAMDKREINEFGWLTVEDNPITKVGVFPYLGSQIGAPEPDRVYMVYRPAEELNNAETIESFKLTPFINEHPKTLLGNINGLVATDAKRVEGVFGEKVYFEHPYLKANLRVYSAQTLDSIDLGKEELSAGYTCEWSRENGSFEGVAYEYAQRKIRGNHGALVEEGRSGPDVSVMDSMTFKLDSKEHQMDLKELVQSVAALTEKMTTFQGAMDSMKKAMDESEEDKDKKDDKDGKALDEDDDKKKDDDKDGDKKAMDEDDEKKDDDKKDDKKDAMDAALKQIKVLTAQVAKLSAAPAALDSGALMAEIAKKNELVAKASHHIGAFACDSMSYVQAAEYVAEKLGLPKDNAAIRVESYLAAKPASTTAYGMDAAGAKSTGAAFLAEQLK